MTSLRRLAMIAAIAAAVTALALATTPHAAKDAVGVYALVDRVVFEPNADNPARVQVWGIFRVADTFGIKDGKLDRISLGQFHPTAQGYMYFSVNPTAPDVSRVEWRALERYAGTGRPVAFGSRVPPAGETAITAGGMDTTVLQDTAALGELIRYNGRVRSADESVSDPDVYPLRMTGFPPPILANTSMPVVRQLLLSAAEERRTSGGPRR